MKKYIIWGICLFTTTPTNANAAPVCPSGEELFETIFNVDSLSPIFNLFNIPGGFMNLDYSLPTLRQETPSDKSVTCFYEYGDKNSITITVTLPDQNQKNKKPSFRVNRK